MKITYRIGKSKNWKESATVGIIGAFLCIVGSVICAVLPPLLLGLGAIILVAGLAGFMKMVD